MDDVLNYTYRVELDALTELDSATEPYCKSHETR